MMALKIKVSETKIVLENLLICAAVFYMVYYVAHIICFKALGLDSFDEFGPFDFKTNPSWLNKKYLVNLISLETTFMVCGLLFVLVVEEWIWDYACTVTVIHVIITSMVTMEFPLTGHWWISLEDSIPVHILSAIGGYSTRIFSSGWKIPDLPPRQLKDYLH
ncbi:hypothetical protein FKM82_010827 [Ascaphus truei]